MSEQQGNQDNQEERDTNHEEGVLSRADMQPVGQWVGDIPPAPDSEEGVLSREDMAPVGQYVGDVPAGEDTEEGVLSRDDLAPFTEYEYPPEGERQLGLDENIQEVAQKQEQERLANQDVVTQPDDSDKPPDFANTSQPGVSGPESATSLTKPGGGTGSRRKK